MTAADTITHRLQGAWDAQLTFVKGPREGEREPVHLTFLPDGVIIHADQIQGHGGQLPRGIGEWTVHDGRFSYWFNVVLNECSGRPRTVVYVHGQGTLATHGQSFTAGGGSEVYASGGELLVTHRADVRATRAQPSGRDTTVSSVLPTAHQSRSTERN